jgi:hypothetical protein
MPLHYVILFITSFNLDIDIRDTQQSQDLNLQIEFHKDQKVTHECKTVM